MSDFIYDYLNRVLWLFFYPFYPVTLVFFICVILFGMRKFSNRCVLSCLVVLSCVPSLVAVLYLVLEKIYLPFEGGFMFLYVGIGVGLNIIFALILFWLLCLCLSKKLFNILRHPSRIYLCKYLVSKTERMTLVKEINGEHATYAPCYGRSLMRLTWLDNCRRCEWNLRCLC